MLSHPRISSHLPGWLSLGWVIVFWSAMVAAPISALLARVFHSGDAVALLLDPVLLSVVKVTVYQATISTLVSALIGLPLGLWLGRHDFATSRASRWCETLLAIPYGVPTVVAGMTWIVWLGRSGVFASLDWAYSIKAVIVAHVFLNAPWIALLVLQARRQVPENQIRAARTLGASHWRRFSLVNWPYVRWALASGMVQVFGLCAMSFALVLILGGGPPVQTLETAIYSRMRYGGLDLSGAAACAFWELVVTLVPWGLVLVLRNLWSRWRCQLPVVIAEVRHGAWPRGAVAGLGICGLAVVPYGILLGVNTWRSLFRTEVLTTLLGPLEVSLGLASCSAILAVLTAVAGVMAGMLLRGLRWGEPILSFALSLPSGISVLVIGLGVWLVYGEWIDPFEGSFGAMTALLATILFPLAFRNLWPVAAGTQRVLLEAAATLGASPLRAFWQIEWPRWRGPLLSALGVSAGVALGEVSAVSLFYSEKLIPLPLVITRWMAQYRFEEAQSVAAVLLLLSAVTIIWISLLGPGLSSQRYSENHS